MARDLDFRSRDQVTNILDKGIKGVSDKSLEKNVFRGMAAGQRDAAKYNPQHMRDLRKSWEGVKGGGKERMAP